jgi:hypothetical protein
LFLDILVSAVVLVEAEDLVSELQLVQTGERGFRQASIYAMSKFEVALIHHQVVRIVPSRNS